MTKLSEEKRATKIESLQYPSERDIFYHPKTIGEYVDLQERFLRAKECDDIQGLFVIGMQLMPTVITSDDGKMTDDEVEEALQKISDAHPEAALAWINEKVYCDCGHRHDDDYSPLEWG